MQVMRGRGELVSWHCKTETLTVSGVEHALFPPPHHHHPHRTPNYTIQFYMYGLLCCPAVCKCGAVH